MADKQFDRAPLHDPEAALERAFIEEYLHEHGTDTASLRTLPPDLAKKLMEEACGFAATRLAEVAARSHYIHELHGEG
jgi:hypothetical protein